MAGRTHGALVFLCVSLALSAAAVAFPLLYPQALPLGPLSLLAITIPIGVAAMACGFAARSVKAIVVGGCCGFSPILLVWLRVAFIPVVTLLGFVVVGGSV